MEITFLGVFWSLLTSLLFMSLLLLRLRRQVLITKYMIWAAVQVVNFMSLNRSIVITAGKLTFASLLFTALLVAPSVVERDRWVLG